MKNLTQKFYTLTELSGMVNLSYRQLLNRVKVISRKYKNSDLIVKNGNKWVIHYSLIRTEFKRDRTPIDFKLFTTIHSRERCDIDYWKRIVRELNRAILFVDRYNRFKYVIEEKNGNYHLHFMTTYDKYNQLKKIIKNHYLTSDENAMNILVKKISDVQGLHKYFRKQNKPVLLNKPFRKKNCQ
jgi:hypothetical protein